MVAPFAFVILVVATLPESGDAAPAVAAVAAAEVPRRMGDELREATETALRRWGRVGAVEADQGARELLVLYEELLADRELPAVRRESLRVRVRYRLGELGRQIGQRIAMEERGNKPPAVAPPVGLNVNAQLLPQQQAAGRGGAAPIRAAGGGQMARPAGQAGDGGQALVELIQNVIAPSTWDVNGGSGSIRYWRPGHALVVRQTEQVHEDVDGLLRQLERANR